MAIILVIDDDPVIRTLLADFLSIHNHTVYQAETGQKGLELLKSGAIELVLLDFQMPDLSGIEVLKIIRNDYSEAIKVILLSAQNNSKKSVDAAGLSAEGYLQKPFEMKNLLEEISTILTK